MVEAANLAEDESCTQTYNTLRGSQYFKQRPPKQWYKFLKIDYGPQDIASCDFKSNVYEKH